MSNEIYGLVCDCGVCDPDEVRYVGKTSKGASERLKAHKAVSRGSKIHLPVSRWIQKHGEDNIRAKVLQSSEKEENLSDLERYWISKQGTLKVSSMSRGLNLTAGGEGVSGYKFSDEFKTRFRTRTKAQFSKRHPRKILSDEDATRIRARVWDGENPDDIHADYTYVTLSVILKLAQSRYRPSIPFPDRPRTRRAAPAGDKIRQVRGRFQKGELEAAVNELFSTGKYTKTEVANILGVSNASITKYTKPLV